MDNLNIITGRAVDMAYRIHAKLGPGMVALMKDGVVRIVNGI